MANSTYLDTVNRVLKRAGQKTIADANTFNGVSGTLTKAQVQAQVYVDEALTRNFSFGKAAHFSACFSFQRLRIFTWRLWTLC
jgi:hypothetical protein